MPGSKKGRYKNAQIVFPIIFSNLDSDNDDCHRPPRSVGGLRARVVGRARTHAKADGLVAADVGDRMTNLNFPKGVLPHGNVSLRDYRTEQMLEMADMLKVILDHLDALYERVERLEKLLVKDNRLE